VDSKKISVKEITHGNNITAFNVARTPKRTTFDVQIKDKRMHFILHSSHNIAQLLPGIYLADYLGMNEKEIKKILASLK
jgi:UDP-N-acetylmuramyl pentapeptide synthase